MSLELKIAVCDDEEYYRNYIKKLIKDYLVMENVDYSISLFSGGNEFCRDEYNIQQYDIIFLDIEMGEMSGMDVAHIIRKSNQKVDIVFITVMLDYVFEGYRVDALRYIMKDDLEQLLPECIKKVIDKKRSQCSKMLFEFVGGDREIDIHEVMYIESNGHKLLFKRDGDTLSMYEKINHVEKKLLDFGFIRTHQSYLVNVEYIEKIANYTIYLTDGREIPVTKPRYAEVKESYLRYIEKI